ncbi:DNA starvation/stationary phase protection protein [Rubripirellula sp.]|nr:DNA starvation/stationary phase protection protein [Rubripirellula sp.]
MTAVYDRAIERWENEGGNAHSQFVTGPMANKTECLLPPAPVSVCRCHATREFGHLIPSSILNETFCQQSVDNLNQLLADAMCLRDMYNKHRWQADGPTFHQLHEFFGKHAAQQSKIVDTIAERIMILGGISVSMAQEVADTTMIPCPPRDCECPEAQLSRLLQAHEITLQSARPMARQASEMGDVGTNDMLASDVIRVNELQSRLVAKHLNVTPPYRVKICE